MKQVDEDVAMKIDPIATKHQELVDPKLKLVLENSKAPAPAPM